MTKGVIKILSSSVVFFCLFGAIRGVSQSVTNLEERIRRNIAAINGSRNESVSAYRKRSAAESDLREIGAPAIPAIVAGLKNNRVMVRRRLLDLCEWMIPAPKDGMESNPHTILLANALIELLHDTDKDVRLKALSTLGKMGRHTQIVIPAVARSLADADQNIRETAGESLHRFSHEMRDSGSVLLDLLQSNDPRISGVVSNILAEMTSKVPMAIDVIRSAQGGFQVRPALPPPPDDLDPTARIAILKVQNATNSSIRNDAVKALRTIGSNGVPTLIQALDDLRGIRLSALNALAEIGPDAKAAVPRLIAEVDRKDYWMLDSAWALGRIGAPARPAIPVLVERIRAFGTVDMSKKERSEAAALYMYADSLSGIAGGLRTTPDTEAIPDLEKALEVLENANFPPKTLRTIREPLEFLKALRAAGRGTPATPGDIEACWNLVVEIKGTLDGETRIGSGIIFGYQDDRIYIATARHVVRRATRVLTNVTVRMKSLPVELLPAEVTEHSDSFRDLAVVVVRNVQKAKVLVHNLPFDRRGKPGSLKAGEKVYALGLPMEQTALSTQPDEFLKAVDPKLLFQSQTVRPGYSGGALFDENWRLVGMIQRDDSVFVEAMSLPAILDQLKDWGYPISFPLNSP